MTHKCRSILLVFLTLSLALPGLAQEDQPEVSLQAPEFPGLQWGKQTFTFDVTNNTLYLKFIVVQQTITAEGKYETTQRIKTTNHVLWPEESREIDVTLEIPGIYGNASALIAVYDVVDTMDAIYPGYDIFMRNLEHSFEVPDALLDYAQADLQVPPRVDKGMDFGYDFARLLVALVEEGRSVSEIADLAGCSESYVTRTIDSMTSRRYLRQSSAGPQLSIPFIDAAHAQRAAATIDSLAARMARQVEQNLATYPPLLDSLQQAGALSADSNDFMDMGTVIFRRYAMAVPMLLWYDLGQEFVTRPNMLFIYENSDPCNAWIPEYMYMVEQGSQYDGGHYFLMTVKRTPRLKMIFADHTPELECPEQYWEEEGLLLEKRGWKYATEDLPENFLIDTAMVHLALRHLRSGLGPLLNEARSDAAARGADAGAGRNAYGYRYWYWNLLATRVTEKLLASGAIVRPGNGSLRFEVYP